MCGVPQGGFVFSGTIVSGLLETLLPLRALSMGVPQCCYLGVVQASDD